MADKYMYFLYSDEQIKEKNQILSTTNRVFEPGTVVVNGTRKKFTQLSDKPTIPRFIDSKIIAEGYVDQFTFTDTKVSPRKGN